MELEFFANQIEIVLFACVCVLELFLVGFVLFLFCFVKLNVQQRVRRVVDSSMCKIGLVLGLTFKIA